MSSRLPDSPQPADAIDAGDVRELATRGAAVLGVRSAVIYPVGIAANLLLAHLLVPRDFGIVALGSVLVVLGGYVAEGGFGASLIRRERPPEREELEAVNGIQIGATTLLLIIIAAAAVPFGRDGLIIATMTASLPLTVLRTPSVIVLERKLQYREIATADVVEALVYYAWSVAAVLLGFGVWGLATATVVRSLAGSGTLLTIGPIGPVRPRWSWSHVRPLLGFGVKVQAVGLLQIGREQGLNVVVAGVAGLPTLGIWSLAWRVVQVPLLLALTFGRVAFPALSRLLEAKRDPRPLIERGISIASVLMGVVAVALVSLAPLLPLVVGPKWEPVPAVLFWSGVAMITGPPIALSTAGYLLAAGRAGVVANATLASAGAWFVVAGALLPVYGPKAIGMGWVAAAVVDAAVLWRHAAALSGARISAATFAATAASGVALLCAWGLANSVGIAVLGAVLGLGTGWLILWVGHMAFSRPGLDETRSLIGQALMGLRTKRSGV